MSSTNKTTYYDLSQYTASDKPTYLVDYNGDMSKIDTGLYNAQTTANESEAAIGTLSNLTTEAKNNLVSAINEVDGNVDTLSGTVGQHTTDIASNTSAIGNLTNLNTTAKNNLVAATNEVNSKVNLLNLVNFNTCTLTGGTGTTINSGTVRCASNSDGSLFRLYGGFTMSSTAWTTATITISNTGLPSISEEYTIDGAGFRQMILNNEPNNLRVIAVTVKTNGNIELSVNMESSDTQRIIFFNGLYFNTNFGDTPSA